MTERKVNPQPAYDALRGKHARFVDEYLVDLDQKRAYEAVYKSRGAAAEASASRLLDRKDVQAAIEERKAARVERTEITQDRTLEEVARLAFSDIRRVLSPGGGMREPDEWDEATAAAVSSIKVRELYEDRGEGREQVGTLTEIKLWDKPSSLEKLMKHQGAYEKDNAQRAGIFADVPRDKLKAVLEILKGE